MTLGANAGNSAVGAFFDMDHTLLRSSSGKLYLRYLWQIGYLSWLQWIRIMGDVGLYVVGARDFPHLMGRLMTRLAGSSEQEAWRLSTAWFEAVLRHYIADGARQQIVWHRRQGHHTAIVSAATPYAVRPVAAALGFGEAFLATRLEVIGGRFTGRVLEPACYDMGKVRLTRAYAARHGIDLAQSYFYSDSHRDLPLLLEVGHPVAVNPSRQLARTATKRGWPIQRFY
jgi:putative phosphoserine phosphatase / 1-acylglycerol-3-phosphate O-acyltransferase